MEILKPYSISSWQENISESLQSDAAKILEEGHILFFPQLSFALNQNEKEILSPNYIDSRSKNISFNFLTNEVRGLIDKISADKFSLHQQLLKRFATTAQQFVNELFPRYVKHLQMGRTSYRPVEIKGRASSYRKDDTRLHVDAFPANPNHGRRILRVFCNINPSNQARVWRVGEPFERVVKQFLPQLKKPFPGSAHLLKALKITNQYRTLYDHYMLQLHDKMKGNDVYQREAKQQEIHFPADTTWVVQTDHVSHAAMSGQFLLEQTFYLSIAAMDNPEKSPLLVLEQALGKKLL